MIPTLFLCLNAQPVDGDTIRCEGAPNVRLAGIAARESSGRCLRHHPCPDASAEAATAALRGLVQGRVLRCQATGVTFGRIAAWCWTEDGTDVSCAMMASGTVARWRGYWRGHECR